MRAAMFLVLVLVLAPTTGARATTATWTKLKTAGAAPPARSDAGLAAPTTKTAYLFGGERSGSALGDLWLLDVKARRWTRLSPAGPKPAARFGHDLVAAGDGTLVMFGGQNGDRFFGDTWRYDPAANRWTQVDGPGPRPRYGEGGAFDPASGRLYVTHGFTDDGRFDDTWALSGGAWSELSPAAGGARPLKRCLVGAAFAGGGVYVFGGQSDVRPFLGDLWRFDVAARAWTELHPKRSPSPRALYGYAQLGDAWLVHGGNTRKGAVGDLWSLDLATNEFARVSVKGTKPSARFAEALTPLGAKRALLFGGATPDESADAWVLRLAG